MLTVEPECRYSPAIDVVQLLIVDDSTEDSRRIQNMVEQELGWQVAAAENSDAGLNLLEQEQPHILLTGIGALTGGAEFIEIIRERFGDLPIVLLTGDGDDRAALKALQAGASSYVPRELIESDLADTLSRVFATAQMQTRRRRLNSYLKCSEIEFELENDPAMVAPLVAALQEQLAALGVCSANDTLRVGIALEEAFLNGIYHGNLEVSSDLRQEDGERAFLQAIQNRRRQSPYRERRLQVTAQITRDKGTIVVRDQGPGFDVAHLPDPTDPDNLTRVGGRGILLMRTFMDVVIYNDKGNEVTLIKRRK